MQGNGSPSGKEPAVLSELMPLHIIIELPLLFTFCLFCLKVNTLHTQLLPSSKKTFFHEREYSLLEKNISYAGALTRPYQSFFSVSCSLCTL